jgi:peptidoglycan/xylan/chitin deacetylase (PgdA/CDA1 family)
MTVGERAPDTVVGICFHGIGVPVRGLEPDAGDYFVSRDLFLAVLDDLARHTAVDLTFDDGYASDVEIALPALQERELSASYFPVAGRLGSPGCLDAASVRALAAAGMTVGSHGMAHRSWRGLDPQATEQELTVARAMIADAAGQPVTSAACPFGAYDRRVLAALRRRGYSRVYTSDRRRARSGDWLQPRYSIRHDDTVDTVRDNVLAPRPLRERLRGEVAGWAKAWR